MKNKKLNLVKGIIKINLLAIFAILSIAIGSAAGAGGETIVTPCGNFTNGSGIARQHFTDTYTNNLNVTASDLCVKYDVAWAPLNNNNPFLANLAIKRNPPLCPNNPLKYIGDRIILIDWGNPCVRPGDSVTVDFQGNAGGLWMKALIWTLNGTAIPNQTQPDRPTLLHLGPPAVGQNIGTTYDTTLVNLQTSAADQSACRSCHQTTGTNISGDYNNTIGGVPTRHHNLLPEGLINPYTNTPFGCQDCHPSTPGIGNGILLDRNCQDCHNGTNFWADTSLGAHVGNVTRPHHVNTSYDDANIGNPAANRTCNFCHGSFVDNYNDGHYKPAYNTDFMITPYSTFKITNFSDPNPISVFDSYGNQVLNRTWGGCESCHLADPNAIPAIADNANTHHTAILNNSLNTAIGWTPFRFNITNETVYRVRTCSTCHVVCNDLSGSCGPPRIFNTTNQFTGESLTNAMEVRNSTIEQADAAIGAFEPGTVNISINGTGCEKCHSVKSIHNIQYNYDAVNRTPGLGHINNNSDCYGCHNSWLASDTWTPGALIPTVDSVSPSVVTVGTATTLSITGSNFVNDVTNPDRSVTHYTSVVTVDGAIYTPTSITDGQIVVNIPALSAGIHQVQLVKGGDTLSKLFTLTVVNNPIITSAILSPGKNGQPGTITITGKRFGAKPANATMYVSVNHAGNQIVSSSVSRWTDSQIIVKNSVALPGDVLTVLTTNAGEAIRSIQ